MKNWIDDFMNMEEIIDIDDVDWCDIEPVELYEEVGFKAIRFWNDELEYSTTGLEYARSQFEKGYYTKKTFEAAVDRYDKAKEAVSKIEEHIYNTYNYDAATQRVSELVYDYDVARYGKGAFSKEAEEAYAKIWQEISKVVGRFGCEQKQFVDAVSKMYDALYGTKAYDEARAR